MASILAGMVLSATVGLAGALPVAPTVGVLEPDGALFTPGGSYPSLGALNAPVIAWAPRPGGGLWEVATDGGVFTRNAPFLGSMGGHHLNQPIVGMTATPDGAGYWLVASDGGIFTFGDARFYGSTGAIRLNQPIVGMTATPDGAGYWLVASDGGIFTFGDASFYGSLAGRASAPLVSIAGTAGGYDIALADGSIWQFGVGDPGTEVAQLAIPASYQGAAHQSLAARKALAVALGLVGTPYVTGGSAPGGFDCSGLTQYAYAAAGIALPRTALQQFDAVPHVPLADVQPGDLLFFYPGITHVGIYIGNGLMVDAPHPGTTVQVEAFSWFGPVMGVGRPS
ncbi:MAG TPA: C40 family peptidase [Acidimicrobiales bacterium]|nr:C40 family peptidase [Acidimicrobiales bacterium]